MPRFMFPSKLTCLLRRHHYAQKPWIGVLALCLLPLAGGTASAAGQEKGSLSLYIEESVQEEYREVFDAYREAYPGVELQVETYPAQEYREARGRRNAMLLEGEGPDLLLLGVYDNDDLYKAMSSGLFAPLEGFMERDKDYRPEDYMGNVMEAGVWNSSQYVIPLQYDVSCLISSEECLEEIGFDLEECGTFDGLFSQMTDLYDTEYSYKVMGNAGIFDALPDIMGLELLDYENCQVSADSPELKRAMEQYKKMYKEVLLQISNRLEQGGFSGIGKAIGRREAYFAAGYGIYHTLSVCRGIAETETPVLIPIRTLDGKINGTAVSSAAVRANSPNQENAWNMIRMMLEYQAKGVGLTGVYFPVNQAGFALTEEKALKDMELYESGGEISQELLESYREIQKEAEHVYFNRGITAGYLTQRVMVPYLTGSASYEACIEQYTEYVQSYLAK